MRPILLALVALPFAARVANGEVLTIGAAVARALANNQNVQAAAARAAEATARADQAAGYRLPSVDLAETYVGTENPAEAFALQLNQERFDKQAFFAGDPNNPGWLDTWITRVEVTQPVYTGGRLSARVGQARRMAAAAGLSSSHAREEAGFATVTAFTNLAKARDYQRLLEAARATTAEHVRLAEQFAAQGLIVEAEVLKARVYLAEVDEVLATARSGALLAEAALNFEMGEDQASHWELGPFAEPAPVGGELGGWTTRALAQRRDLDAARQQVDAGRLEEDVAKASFLPEVAVVGRYDLYDDVPFGSHGGSGALMGVARVNLFRGGADAGAVAAARHQTKSSESEIRRFEEGVKLQVQQAWQDLVTAGARHSTASASLAAAREAVTVREARFRQGVDRMIDLLDAETALRDAEVRELVARFDLALASYRLQFASGTSLIELLLPTEETP